MEMIGLTRKHIDKERYRDMNNHGFESSSTVPSGCKSPGQGSCV
jgi:hypothetical protein